MKIIAPDYYEEFSCRLGKCRHTCCAGWEVEIDNETLKYYESLPSDDREWIFRFVKRENGKSFFDRNGGSKCPFLREDGLCQMIIRLGPDSLCDNCLDHPLFRNYFSDRVEIGLGLCCESACSLVMRRKDAVSLMVADDGGKDEEPSKEDDAFFTFRDELFAVAQDRNVPLLNRFDILSRKADFSIRDSRDFLKFISSLESMDENWRSMILHAAENECAVSVSVKDEIPLEQFLAYSIYRNGGLSMKYALSLFYICLVLVSLYPDTDAEEIVRLISSEIEYSDENPGKIIAYLA